MEKKVEVVKVTTLTCPDSMRQGNSCTAQCSDCKYCVLTLSDGREISTKQAMKEGIKF